MRHERTTMTPEQLGITAAEHEGLRALADDLAAGRIVHRAVPHNFGELLRMRREPAEAFNMSEWCGTACCIRGWLAERGVVDRDTLVTNKRLVPLFSPSWGADPTWPDDARYADVTPAQAARAIRNFLSSGKSRWGDALRELPS